MDSENGINQLDLDIKPKITVTEAKGLAERLYGLSVEDIQEIIAYDDRNYVIKEDKCVNMIIYLTIFF